MSKSLDAETTAAEMLKVLPLLNRIMNEEIRRVVGPDTTMPQYRVLQFLSEGPMSLSDLAHQRRVSLQSMSELAQMMVERGWLARKPNPDDRRQQLLELTREGRKHYARAQENMLLRLTPILAQLPADEHAAVRTALASLYRVLVQAADEAADEMEMSLAEARSK
jgi:DNA-binding MarR family transcriptional regulator